MATNALVVLARNEEENFESGMRDIHLFGMSGTHMSYTQTLKSKLVTDILQPFLLSKIVANDIFLRIIYSRTLKLV